jgi:hypothetical protein
MEKDDSLFIRNLRVLSNDDRERVMSLFERDKHRGLIKPEADVAIVIDMLTTLSTAEFFKSGLDGERFFTRLEKMIKIIKCGISAV